MKRLSSWMSERDPYASTIISLHETWSAGIVDLHAFMQQPPQRALAARRTIFSSIFGRATMIFGRVQPRFGRPFRCGLSPHQDRNRTLSIRTSRRRTRSTTETSNSCSRCALGELLIKDLGKFPSLPPKAAGNSRSLAGRFGSASVCP